MLSILNTKTNIDFMLFDVAHKKIHKIHNTTPNIMRYFFFFNSHNFDVEFDLDEIFEWENNKEDEEEDLNVWKNGKWKNTRIL